MPGEGFEPPTFGLQNRCTATVLTRRDCNARGAPKGASLVPRLASPSQPLTFKARESPTGVRLRRLLAHCRRAGMARVVSQWVTRQRRAGFPVARCSTIARVRRGDHAAAVRHVCLARLNLGLLRE